MDSKAVPLCFCAFHVDQVHVHLEQEEPVCAMEQGALCSLGRWPESGARDVGLSLHVQMGLVPGLRHLGVFIKPTLAILRNSKESERAGP